MRHTREVFERESPNTFADENRALREELFRTRTDRDRYKKALDELRARLGYDKPMKDRRLRSV